MPTRDLVDALISGDSIAIENTFNAAMSESEMFADVEKYLE